MGADASKKKIDKYFLVNGILPLDSFFLNDKLNIKHNIFLSSETIYGMGDNKKENSKKSPIHPYSYSKLIAELNLINFYKKYLNRKFGLTILRLPVIIFKSKKNLNTLSSICYDFKKNEDILVFGDGKHRRKYLFSKDLNKFIYQVTNYNHNNKYNIFNAPGFVASSIDIINYIKKKFDKKNKLNFIKSKKAFSLTSSNDKINSIFNVKIEYSLKKTIKLFMDSYD